MILVDYGGSIFPIISHSPWNGLHLADFVMPFFLFLVGISLALAYKVCMYYLFTPSTTHSTQFPIHHSFLFIKMSEKAT
jgi:predicted acyltransferase